MGIPPSSHNKSMWGLALPLPLRPDEAGQLANISDVGNRLGKALSSVVWESFLRPNCISASYIRWCLGQVLYAFCLVVQSLRPPIVQVSWFWWSPCGVLISFKAKSYSVYSSKRVPSSIQCLALGLHLSEWAAAWVFLWVYCCEETQWSWQFLPRQRFNWGWPKVSEVHSILGRKQGIL